jgi:hypothetical protein
MWCRSNEHSKILSYILDNMETYGPLPNNTTITIQMGHDLWDKLTDYSATSNELYTPFYSNAMKRDISSHPSLSALHRQERTWQEGQSFYRLEDSKLIWNSNRTFPKLYTYSQHVASCIFPARYRVTPCTILPGVREGGVHGVNSAATTHKFLSYYGSELAPWVS